MIDIFEQFQRKHKENVEDFGVPERFIDGSDVKFWRFIGLVIDTLVRPVQVAWPDIVPVFSGKNLIGHATLYPHNNEIWARVSATADIPERLDYEMGVPFELLPVTIYDNSVISIKALELIRAEVDDRHCIAEVLD